MAISVFIVSFLVSYFLVVPGWHQHLPDGMSIGLLSALIAWLWSLVVMVFVAWFGMFSNFLKMLGAQTNKWNAISSFTFNPFYRFSNSCLNAEGINHRDCFLVYLSGFFIAFVSAIPLVLFTCWLSI
jgi:hypothetical protein